MSGGVGEAVRWWGLGTYYFLRLSQFVEWCMSHSQMQFIHYLGWCFSRWLRMYCADYYVRYAFGIGPGLWFGTFFRLTVFWFYVSIHVYILWLVCICFGCHLYEFLCLLFYNEWLLNFPVLKTFCLWYGLFLWFLIVFCCIISLYDSFWWWWLYLSCIVFLFACVRFIDYVTIILPCVYVSFYLSNKCFICFIGLILASFVAKHITLCWFVDWCTESGVSIILGVLVLTVWLQSLSSLQRV